jgi:hypothetical protein
VVSRLRRTGLWDFGGLRAQVKESLLCGSKKSNIY